MTTRHTDFESAEHNPRAGRQRAAALAVREMRSALREKLAALGFSAAAVDDAALDQLLLHHGDYCRLAEAAGVKTPAMKKMSNTDTRLLQMAESMGVDPAKAKEFIENEIEEEGMSPTERMIRKFCGTTH